MSTPNMSGPQGQGGQSWMGYPPHGQPTPPPPAPSAMAQSASPDEALLQTRPMGREYLASRVSSLVASAS